MFIGICVYIFLKFVEFVSRESHAGSMWQLLYGDFNVVINNSGSFLANDLQLKLDVTVDSFAVIFWTNVAWHKRCVTTQVTAAKETKHDLGISSMEKFNNLTIKGGFWCRENQCSFVNHCERDI